MQCPEAYDKLLQEINQADKKGKLSQYVTYAECLELPYLYVFLYFLITEIDRKTKFGQKASSYERSNAMPSWGIISP